MNCKTQIWILEWTQVWWSGGWIGKKGIYEEQASNLVVLEMKVFEFASSYPDGEEYRANTKLGSGGEERDRMECVVGHWNRRRERPTKEAGVREKQKVSRLNGVIRGAYQLQSLNI